MCKLYPYHVFHCILSTPNQAFNYLPFQSDHAILYVCFHTNGHQMSYCSKSSSATMSLRSSSPVRLASSPSSFSSFTSVLAWKDVGQYINAHSEMLIAACPYLSLDCSVLLLIIIIVRDAILSSFAFLTLLRRGVFVFGLRFALWSSRGVAILPLSVLVLGLPGGARLLLLLDFGGSAWPLLVSHTSQR